MKSNDEIFESLLDESEKGEDMFYSKDFALSAMKAAQYEILHRFVINFESYPNIEAKYPFKFQMAAEKSHREIEEGREYGWTEFMVYRHKQDEKN